MMRRTLFDIAVAAVCLTLLGFFAWHSQKGERSWENARATERLVASLEGDLAKIRTERQTLEARVKLLRPDSIDPDMVGELARKTLGFVHEGDIVVETGR
jgi:cell division protein FtsB